MTTTADIAKKISIQFSKELGFVNLAALRVAESKSHLEVVQDIGFVNFHHRKDKQTTIYEIAVHKSAHKQGWGRLLFYRVLCSAIENCCTSIVAKCPEDLYSNGFYQKMGFKLLRIEEGKKRKLNVWQYTITVPLLFYCGDAGGSKYDEIAIKCGWRMGVRSDRTKKHRIHCQMVDNHWINYNHARHLDIVQRQKPLIATARDIESLEQLPEILFQAQELAQYCGRVLLIPKCKFPLPDFKHWLGFSIPSKYGHTPIEPEWFGDRPCHLLGGSPSSQAKYASLLNVISLDANYACNLARFGRSCWQGYSSGIRVTNGNYKSFELSLVKQKQYWHKSWTWLDEPLSQFSYQKL